LVVFYLTGETTDGRVLQVQEVINDDTVVIEYVSRTGPAKPVRVTCRRASAPRPPMSWDFLL